MQDDENDLDGLFEEYENDDVENANIEDVASKSKPSENAEKVAAPRRAVKNPRLKFNADRLCGERGIPIVVKHFENVKFKGKGHEVEDLNKLLATLEHWCHRLYPSMKFEDCLRQIEKLGKKRPVQTCLRKIRLDMPLLNKDFVRDDPEENKNQDEIEVPPQDAFDRLISDIQDNANAQLVSTPLPVKKSNPEQKLGSVGSTLTEEQRKRMEYNKMLATERRKAKFLLQQSSPSNYENKDIFTAETSFTDLGTSHTNGNPTSDDIFDKLLFSDASKMHPNSVVNEISEELELDDLVNLVNEEEEPSLIGNEDNSSISNKKVSSTVSKSHHKFIDLSFEDENELLQTSNQVEVVDLEKEANTTTDFVQNKQVEVIDIENKTPVIVDLIENEPFRTDIINNDSIAVINLDDEVDLITNNSKATPTNTPATFTRESHNNELESSVSRAIIPESLEIEDDTSVNGVESMEVD